MSSSVLTLNSYSNRTNFRSFKKPKILTNLTLALSTLKIKKLLPGWPLVF